MAWRLEWLLLTIQVCFARVLFRHYGVLSLNHPLFYPFEEIKKRPRNTIPVEDYLIPQSPFNPLVSPVFLSISYQESPLIIHQFTDPALLNVNMSAPEYSVRCFRFGLTEALVELTRKVNSCALKIRFSRGFPWTDSSRVFTTRKGVSCSVSRLAWSLTFYNFSKWPVTTTAGQGPTLLSSPGGSRVLDTLC